MTPIDLELPPQRAVTEAGLDCKSHAQLTIKVWKPAAFAARIPRAAQTAHLPDGNPLRHTARSTSLTIASVLVQRFWQLRRRYR